MTLPIETKTIGQLPSAVAVPRDTLMAVEVGGVTFKISLARLLSTLFAADESVATKADILTTETAMELPLSGTVVVYADPVITNNGYWIRRGLVGDLTDFVKGDLAFAEIAVEATERAEDAADRAENAEQALAIGATIYDNEAAGIAAVANGVSFWSWAADGSIQRRTRVDAATSTLKSYLIGGPVIDGRIGQRVGPAGRFEVRGDAGVAARLDPFRWRGAPFERTEAAALQAQRRRLSSLNQATVTSVAPAVQSKAATEGKMNGGQSLTTGTSGGRLGVRSVCAPASIFCLDTGIVRPGGGRGATPSRRTATEAAVNCGMLDREKFYRQLMRDNHGIDPHVGGADTILLNAGVNGQAIQALNTTQYHCGTEIDAAIYTTPANKPFALVAYFFRHGPGDVTANTAEQTYIDRVCTHIDQMRADAAAKTGFSTPVPIFISQTAAHIGNGRTDPAIARAQQRLIRERPRTHIYCAGPEHDCVFYDANHMNPTQGYSRLATREAFAEYCVRQLREDYRYLDAFVEIDGKHMVLHPLYLREGERFGFQTYGGRCPEQPNWGIQPVTAGAVNITVDRVHQTASGSIVVTTPAARSATDYLRLGYTTNVAAANYLGGASTAVNAPCTGNVGLHNVGAILPDLVFEPKRRAKVFRRPLLIGDYRVPA